ncbi:MAG: GDP-mannose 4,6-dehydratase [archaeon]
MEALITGVNGFVGTYLKEFLLEKGYTVFGTGRSGNVDFRVDLLNYSEVEDLIIKTKPKYVFHLAANSSVKLSWENPENTIDENILCTKNLIDAIKEHSPETIILLVSSSHVYDISSEILKETSKINPISPYGQSKLEQEKLLIDSGLKWIISRSFTHIGPRQSTLFVCSELAKEIVDIERGKKPVIYVGDTSVERDFTDVRDVVRAYLLMVEKCDLNEIYNVCSGEIHTIRKILDILISLSDKEIEIKIDESKLRKNDIKKMVGDNSKFVQKTGWKREISIEQTLKDLLDYWRSKQQTTQQ